MNKKILTFRLDLRSRLPTLESYRPISNLSARCGNFKIKSIKIISIELKISKN